MGAEPNAETLRQRRLGSTALRVLTQGLHPGVKLDFFSLNQSGDFTLVYSDWLDRHLGLFDQILKITFLST